MMTEKSSCHDKNWFYFPPSYNEYQMKFYFPWKLLLGKCDGKTDEDKIEETALFLGETVLFLSETVLLPG